MASVTSSFENNATIRKIASPKYPSRASSSRHSSPNADEISFSSDFFLSFGGGANNA